MPRVKATDTTLKLELRITPPDGEPITDWQITDDHKSFVAFLEGGPGTGKALHYHCLLEYARSRTLLKKWIYSIARCNNGETGNAVFFSRKPHSHTYGYIAKHRNCAYRSNIDQGTIDEWIEQSEEYCKQKENARKRKQRSREQLVSSIKETISKGLQDRSIEPNVEAVADRLLAEFHNAELSLPPRSSFETLVMTLMYKVDRSYVRSYYTKYLHAY